MIERINLAPRKAVPNKIWALIYILTGLLFVIAGLSLYVVYNSTAKKLNRIDMLANKSTQCDNNVTKLQSKVTALKVAIDNQKKLIHKLSINAKKTRTVQAQKHYYSRVLQGITEQLPDSIKCNKISVNRKDGTIDGTATLYNTLPDFVAKLHDDTSVFSSVTLQTIDKSPLGDTTIEYKFKIVFTIQ